MFTLITCIQHSTGVLVRVISQEKEKVIQFGNEKVKLYLFTDMIFYVENSKDATKKLQN